MNRALIFLLSRSLTNAVVARFKRLRQPKYLAGTLIGAAYFYFYFFRIVFGGGGGGGRREPLPAGFALDRAATMEVAALVAFVAFVVLAWIIPASRAALVFTEAEMAFLLPAPIDRAALIRYKLLKSQLGLLLLAVLMTLITGRLVSDGLAVIHALGWWVVFATLQLHRLGASFVFTRALDRGLSTTGRRLIALAVAAGFIALLGAWKQAAPAAPLPAQQTQAAAWTSYLHELVTAGPAPWLLAPFRIVVRPFFSANAAEFLVALLPALGLMALHYIWIMRSDVALEDASIELSQKRADFVAARRSGNLRFGGAPKGRREPLFRLRPRGWRFAAFTWKSFIQAGGRRTIRIALIVAFALAAGSLAVGQSPRLSGFGVFFRMAGTMALFVSFLAGPQMIAQSIRRELLAADWLKTMPVPNSHIMFGLLLGPALLVTALQTAAIGLSVFQAGTGGLMEKISPFAPLPALFILAVIALPALNIVFSLVPTGAMILFPGWFRPGEQRGIEATGLGLIMVVGQFALILIALIPPGLAAAGAGFGAQFFAPASVAFGLAALAAAGTLWLEAWLGMLLVSTILASYDPSRE